MDGPQFLLIDPSLKVTFVTLAAGLRMAESADLPGSTIRREKPANAC
jgi:hypothetical protein